MSDTHDKAVTVIERDSDRLHPMVRAAMAGGPDPAMLRELLTLQREWEAGEAKRAYTEAMIALKRDLPAVINRDGNVDYKPEGKARVTYRHATLAAAMDAVIPCLTSHGFSINWEPSTPTPGMVTVSAKLTHMDGHSETVTLSAPPDTKGGKDPAAAVMSTITRLERYSALAILGIATADMEPRETIIRDSDEVDTARNLKLVADLRKANKALADAEQVVNRKVDAWTLGDLDRIRCWMESGTEDDGLDAYPERLRKGARELGLNGDQIQVMLDEQTGTPKEKEDAVYNALKLRYKREHGK